MRSEAAMDNAEKEKIRRYLLGSASPTEQNSVEERLGDNAYDEEFGLVEDELIDDYVLGVLREAERRNFIDYFLGSPEHREKVKHVETVAALVSAQPALEQSAEEHKKRTLGRIWKEALPFTAAALILLIMNFLFLIPLRDRAGRLTDEKEAAEAKAELLERELEEARAQAVTSNKRVQEIEHLRKRMAELEKQLAQEQTREQAEPLFVFASSRDRATTTPRKITIKRSQQIVKFRLFLPDSAQSDSYRAYLMRGDDTVWLESSLEVRGRRRRFIELTIPATSFRQGRQVLVLEAKVGSKYEKIDAYPLDIRLR